MFKNLGPRPMPLYDFVHNFTNSSIKYQFSTDLEKEPNIPTSSIVFFIYLSIFFLLLKNQAKDSKNTNPRKPPGTKHVFITHLGLSITNFLLATIILPVIFACLLFFTIIKYTVYAKLKLKHGSNFWGILPGGDTVWTIEDQSKSVINILVFLECANSSGNGEVFEAIKSGLREKLLEKLPKLSCTRHKCFGYNYLIKNSFKIEEFVKVFQIDTEESLREFVSDVANSDLPEKNTALWEAFVGCARLKNTENVPVLFRIHHSLGDGVSLVKLLIGCLADPKKIEKVQVKELEKLSSFSKIMGVLVGLPLSFYRMSLKMVADENVLHGPQLSGKKLVVFGMEKERAVLKVVKNIKRCVPEVRFLDVLLAALSASFGEFYKKNSKIPPDSVTAVIPTLMDLADLQHLEAGSLQNEKEILRNNFSLAMLNLPILSPENNDDIFLTETNNRLIETLKEIQRRRKLLDEAPDYQINYWILGIVSAILPEVLLRCVLNSVHSTVTVSNLPGCEKQTIFNGKTIKNIVFFLPHRGTTGLGFSILTYDGRFQFGLSADKTLISCEKQAQEIVDGVFKYLFLLDEEVRKSRN